MSSEPPNLRTREGVNEDFVANTSIPVIPRLRLPQTGRKIFWTIVTVLSLVVFLWQFYLMLTKFFSYPVSVNIEMGFKELDFPAVTICNHNRFRSSKLHLAGPQFVAFVQGVETSSNDQLSGKMAPTRKKRGADGTPPGSGNSRGSGNSGSPGNSGKSGKSRGSGNSGSPGNSGKSRSSGSSSSSSSSSSSGSTRSSGSSRNSRVEFTRTINTTTVVTRRRGSGTTTTELFSDLGDIKKSRRRPTTMAPKKDKEKKEKKEKKEEKEPETVIDTGEPEWNSQEAEVDFETPVKLSKAAAAVGKYYQPKVNISEKPWYAPAPDASVQTEEQMAIIMSKIPVSVKSAMGHSITDFIQEVVWNGQKLSPEVFKVFQSNMFGNCYTFNAADLQTEKVKTTKKPGAGFGLKITLMLEQDEYMSGAFSPTAGARIVLHEPASPAFPEDRGVDVHPGTLTSISVKFIEYQRLKYPHGNCTDGENSPFVGRPILYDINGRYSIQACERSCRQYYNLDLCECAEPGTPTPEGSTLCTVDNVTCIEDVRKRYNAGELKCSCEPPCSEQRYMTGQSSSMWPSIAYVETLRASMSTRGGRIKEILEKDAKSLGENLLKVNIFYEDLNFERYQEVESYGIENLLGDLGGQLGLWLGLTVISFWEIAEYFGLLFILIFRSEKSTAKNRKYKTNGDANDEGVSSTL